MLKIVPADTIERSGLFGTPPAEFPFIFLPAYNRYLMGQGHGRVVFFQDSRRRVTAPIRLFRNRIMKLGQWLSPPMRDGRTLGAVEECTFVDEANCVLRWERLCDRLIQPPNQALFQLAPQGSRHCSFGTFLLPLKGRTEDELLANFHSHHRRDIRKSIREGAIIRSGASEIPTFHRLHQQTMRRSQLPSVSLSALSALYEALGPHQVACVVAYAPDGQPEGGVFAPYTKEGAYYLYGASTIRPRMTGAIKLAHWELIRHCLSQGVRQYNLVGARLSDVAGTKLDQIQKFKARFGATLQEGVLWKLDLNPAKANLYETANGIRRGLRWLRGGKIRTFDDIIDQEISRQKKV